MTAIDEFFRALSAPAGSGSLVAGLPKRFTIAAGGPYPLAKHAPIEGSAIGGQILIAFDRLDVGPLAVARIERGADERDITVLLQPAQLQGHYELFGLEQPRITLDTGGAVQPFMRLETDGDVNITEKQFDQLNQANEQRAKLNQTDKGRAMMQAYDRHNDAYNDVFNTNEQLRKYWVGDGTTAEMADHTSTALKTEGVVNPPDKTFSNGYNYNYNAFAQKLHVAMACAKPHPEAGKAALRFQDSVQTQTGNTQKETRAMTGAAVYATIHAASTDAFTAATTPLDEPHPLFEALVQLVEQPAAAVGAGEGTAAVSSAQPHLAVLRAHGFDPDERMIGALRDIHAASLRAHAAENRVRVHAGTCSLAFGETSFSYRLMLQPDGAVTLRLNHTSLSLDGLEMNAAAWPGEAGAVARARLAASGFIRGMLADRIASQLTRLMRRLAATTPR